MKASHYNYVETCSSYQCVKEFKFRVLKFHM